MSWKSLVSSASSRLKEYAATKDPRGLTTPTGEARQTWREWAGEKISYRRSPNNNIEKLSLFPGWAARRYALGTAKDEEPFEVDVFISGFATQHRPPEFATRSQKAFIRVAKSYAGLSSEDLATSLPSKGMPRTGTSTDQLLQGTRLPPRPEDMTQEFEIEALEKQFQRMNSQQDADDDDDLASLPQSRNPSRPPSPTPSTSSVVSNLGKLHETFEARLQPFWSSAVANRTVQIKLYPRPLHSDQDPTMFQPIASANVSTGPDGSFQVTVRIRWEDICQHPTGVQIAFGRFQDEHEVLACAKLQPLPPPSPIPGQPTPPPVMPITTSARIPLSHSPVRVISDIDDTVKHSDVLSGAKTVFQNVFLRDNIELVIPGMADWYQAMWKKGVRFHYISNGPFALLPVLGEFLAVAQLPPGSVKLRSYAGRSLFSGLLSAPASRKRANLLETLDAFPHSRFVLIGDTGEQDMEVYAELAASRPAQILAIYVRQADSTNESSLALDDPMGVEARLHEQSVDSFERQRTRSRASSYTARKTPSIRDGSGDGYFSGVITAEPEPIQGMVATPRANGNGTLTPGGRQATAAYVAERKREELQLRVWNARLVIPDEIAFSVFRRPEECRAEAEGIIGRALRSNGHP